MEITASRKIQERLLKWFGKNGRDLPWRRTRDPYAIWVSEIMLQQTQVATVIPYYRKFLKTFPTIRRLSKADLSKVLSAWEGLGYYSRARNLHRASRVISDRFNGIIPDTLEDLLSLPGIGRSTAAAILSIAYNREAAILDGNVKRVLSRLFAVSGDPGRGETKGLLWHLSESLVPRGRASSFNQALMDLGSMVCTPKDPLCPRCPVLPLCEAKAKGAPERYPIRQAKKKIPHNLAMAAVIQRDGKVVLNQRPPEGLLGGLWEFPNWRVHRKEVWEDKLSSCIKEELGIRLMTKEPLGSFKQTFSHFKLTLDVYRCRTKGGHKKGKWVSLSDLNHFPMSRLHRKIANCLLTAPKMK